MTDVLHKYQPRHWFLSFHTRKERFACMVCHRRCGKTVAVINDMIAKALRCTKEEPFYAYIAPYFSQAKSIAWRYLKRYTEGMREGDPKESELSVTLVNGATLRLFGADNPDALRGLYFDGVALDEFGDMKGSVWTSIILPALLDRGGWAVFIGTPKGRNAFYKVYMDALVDSDWFNLMLKAGQTDALSPKSLELARKNMDEDEFERELMCSFDAAIKGSFYGRILNEYADNLRPFDWNPEFEVQVALDIGRKDDCAGWLWQEIAGERRYLDAFSESGLEAADVVDMLRAQPYQYAPIWLPHDAYHESFQTGKSTAEQFALLGVKHRPVANMSVQAGIGAARLILPISYFNSNSPGIMKCYEHLKLYSREYDEKNEVFRQNPKHNQHSHAADGFRYSAVTKHHPGDVRVNKAKFVGAAPRAMTLEGLFEDRAAASRSMRIT